MGRYPKADRSKMIGRFQSRDDVLFQSAFFELFLHTLLHKIGYQVEVHPQVPELGARRPDFLLRSSKGEMAYLEAVLATASSKEERGRRALIDRFLDGINDLESPNFFINVRWSGQPKSAPPVSKIGRQLRAWLGSLDPDDCLVEYKKSGLDGLPILRWEHRGWRVQFQAHPKSARLRGRPHAPTLGIQMGGVRQVNASKAIRNALKKKVSRYGKLRCPYIIAVNSLEPAMDWLSVEEALFGSEQIGFVVDQDGTEQPILERKDDGVLIGRAFARNTRISGVLLSAGVVPTTIASQESSVCLYHNPWAKWPYSGALCRLRQVKPKEGRLVEVGGLHARDLLKIDPAWLYEYE